MILIWKVFDWIKNTDTARYLHEVAVVVAPVVTQLTLELVPLELLVPPPELVETVVAFCPP